MAGNERKGHLEGVLPCRMVITSEWRYGCFGWKRAKYVETKGICVFGGGSGGNGRRPEMVKKGLARYLAEQNGHYKQMAVGIWC
jgi:hypothetical protein